MVNVKNQFFEDHLKNISFFYTGRANVIGMNYADTVIKNSRNVNYIKIATISFDETLQSSEENIINEVFVINTDNNVNAQYNSNIATVKITAHTSGKRITKDKFKCVITPELEYDNMPELRFTNEMDDTTYKVGIWLKTTGIKNIYLYKIYSNARNAVPLNTQYIDSKYYFNFTQNDDVIIDLDTCNVVGTLEAKQFYIAENSYKSIMDRLDRLESIKYPDVRFCTINTDIGWVPESDGVQSTQYQKVQLSNIDYSTSLSDSFVKLESTIKGFTVKESGLYLIQIINGLTSLSAIKDNRVELILSKNSEYLNDTSMKFTIYGNNVPNNTGFSNGFILINLKASDIIRLNFKFLNEPNGGIINNLCKIQLLKLMDSSIK